MKIMTVVIALVLSMLTGIVLVENASGETRTLTTTLYITVLAAPPEMAGTPEVAKEILTGAFSRSANRQYARSETSGQAGNEAGRYTLTEML